MKRFAACILAAAMAAAYSTQCLAWADDDARRAILELREKLASMQASQVEIAAQVDALRRQNAELTGRVEKLTNDLNVQKKSSRDLFGNLDKRVGVFEDHKVNVDGAEIVVSGEERKRYNTALEMMADGDYAAAGALLEKLISEYPKSGYMPSALYYYGNVLFAQGNAAKALGIQKRMITRFPRHPRVPEAMLSKAACEASTGNAAAARATLAQIRKQYPKTEAARLAEERIRDLQ